MNNKEKNFASAVVYLHNAENTVEPFMEMLIRVMSENFENAEIIMVNDDSTDNSAKLVRKVGNIAERMHVTLLDMGYYQGCEVAMNAGRDAAIGDFVFEFDSVFVDYAEDEIMRAYYLALEGYDVVGAVPDRNIKMSSRWFYRIFNTFSNVQYELSSERFRVLSRRVINRAMNMNYKIPYRKVVYSCCGLPMKRMLYTALQTTRAQDKSMGKTERQYRRNLGIDVLLLFTGVGYRFSISVTVTMIVMMLLEILYSFVMYLFGNPVEGWTTTILFFSFAFFGLFGLFTIVIKYLQILVDLVFKRQQYSIKNLEKLTK